MKNGAVLTIAALAAILTALGFLGGSDGFDRLTFAPFCFALMCLFRYLPEPAPIRAGRTLYRP